MRYGRSNFAVCLLAIAAWLAPAGNWRAQAQDQSQGQDKSQTNGANEKEDQAAPSSNSAEPQAGAAQVSSQTQPPSQPDSLAEAARKAREKKAKQDSGKVFTEDDMSKLPSHGVSVVGDADSSKSSDSGYSNSNYAGNQEEAYWRSRARSLLNQMAAVDQQIEKVKDDIKKYGNGGFDPAKGLANNVIYVQDRQSQLERLQKQRQDLDKQMDQLQEEGRKAGAQSSWFR